jgi:predicted enzyme related to lactoylglutathione lyase
MAAPIVHLELRSLDFARTAAFYRQLFAWETQQNATGSYMKFDGANGPSGGWVRADMSQGPGPIPYLVVDNLVAKLEQVEKAGGHILVRAMPFAGGGEVGLFADPDGNVLGLWMRKKGEGKSDGKVDSKDESRQQPAAKPAKAAPKNTGRRPAKPIRRK